MRDSASSASEKLNALNQVLDLLNGGAKSQAEALRDYHEEVDNIAEAFSKTDENGKNLAKSLVDQSGAIDTSTEAGRELFDQVNALADAYKNEVIATDAAAKAKGEDGVSTEEASKIHARYRDALAEAAKSANLSEEAVAGLTETMLATPEVVAYAVRDDGTVDANKLRLIDLATQIIATPDGEFDVSTDDIPGLMKALSDLGYKTNTLPDGTVRVKGNGIDTTSSALQALHRQVYDRWETITTTRRTLVETVFNTPQHTGYPLAPDNPNFKSTNGNLFSGGNVQAFANGGEPIHSTLPPAIYAGRPRSIYKFAEQETVWEAFISGKPSMRARNQAIAMDAVRRLGGRATFDPADREFADGGILDQDRELKRLDQRQQQLRADFLRKLDISRRSGHRDEAAKKASDDAWTAWDKAYKAYQSQVDAMEREKSQLMSRQDDFYTDLRRGNIDRQGVTGGGLGLVDRLRDAAAATGGNTGRAMEKQALASEKVFLELEKAADESVDAVKDAEAEKTRLVDDATKKWGAAVDEAAKKVDDLTAAAQAMSKRVSDVITGRLNLGVLATATQQTRTVTEQATRTIGGVTVDVSSSRDETVDVPVTAGSVKSGLLAQANAAKQLADKIRRLSAKGFTQDFISEVLSLGLEQAEPMIDALLQMSAADVRDVNALHDQVTLTAGQVGNTVAGTYYDKDIRLAESQLRATEDAAAKEIAAAEAIGNRQIQAAQAAQDAITKALREETEKIKNALAQGLQNPFDAEYRKADGGRIVGPGSGTSDSIPAMLSNGEHVWTAAEVRAAGGHSQVERIRAAVLNHRVPIHLATGGPVAHASRSLYQPYSGSEEPILIEVAGPSELVVVDEGGALIGRMRVEAQKAVTAWDRQSARVVRAGRGRL